MKRLGWKQADLARASNLDSAVISNIINGRRGLGESAARAIARAFDLPPETVFRAAGLLPDKPKADQKIDEALHILSKLDADDLEEIIQIAKMKLERERSKPKKSRSKSPALTLLKR